MIAELLAKEGYAVTLVTPVPQVSQWTTNTMEAHRIRARIIEAGVEVRTDTAVTAVSSNGVTTACRFTGRTGHLDADAVVMVTARLPHDELYTELHSRSDDWSAAGVRGVTGIGDAWAPSTIAAAVWSGHRFAEELDAPRNDDPVPFRREVTQMSIEPIFGSPAPVS